MGLGNNMEWVVVKTLLSLAAVITLMVAVVFVMKKYLYGNQSVSSPVIDMRVIGTLMLQPKRTVSLVKVMNKILIVGVTEEGMRTLGEISDEESLRVVEENTASQASSTKWFAHLMSQRPTRSFADALRFHRGTLSPEESQ